MEPGDIQVVLTSAVEEVLETMCFATVFASSEGSVPPVVTEKDGAAADEGPAITAELRFQSTPSGAFRVSVARNAARQIAAGFLGREEADVSDSQAGEVICELANMICGSVLSRLGTETTFHLFHPKLIQPGAPLAFRRTGTSRWFDLGDGVLTASLEVGQAE